MTTLLEEVVNTDKSDRSDGSDYTEDLYSNLKEDEE